MTQFGEEVAMCLAEKPDGWRFKCIIKEVIFDDTIKVSSSQKIVKAPHWKFDESRGLLDKDAKDRTVGLFGALFSNRPAVYLIQNTDPTLYKATVKIEIIESENTGPQANLSGCIDELTLSGTCPTSVGEHLVEVAIKNVPPGIRWYHGFISWGVDIDPPGLSASIGVTLVELFFIFETPTPIYQNNLGVWAEALRLLCGPAGLISETSTAEATAKISMYCHGKHGLKYDSAGGGGSSYSVGGSGGKFALSRYLKAIDKTVNCYDQAAAIQALCGCLGIKQQWIYLAPFGFIKSTKLIGYGMCNNPFFEMNGSAQLIPDLDPARTYFGNHAFCGSGGNIVDACAGPHTGDETRAQYVDASIDQNMNVYDAFNKRKNAPLYPRVRSGNPSLSSLSDDEIFAFLKSNKALAIELRHGSVALMADEPGVTGVD